MTATHLRLPGYKGKAHLAALANLFGDQRATSQSHSYRNSLHLFLHGPASAPSVRGKRGERPDDESWQLAGAAGRAPPVLALAAGSLPRESHCPSDVATAALAAARHSEMDGLASEMERKTPGGDDEAPQGSGEGRSAAKMCPLHSPERTHLPGAPAALSQREL